MDEYKGENINSDITNSSTPMIYILSNTLHNMDTTRTV